MRSSGHDVSQGRLHAAWPSPNSWDYAFYSSVLADPDFLDYLTKGVLSQKL